jgi:glutamine amidotransferase
MKHATILDYGVGNLHSLAKALAAAGMPVRVEADAARALDATCLILPGVGAFTAAAERLRSVRAAIRQRLTDGVPCLAICLGMQLLFSSSEEGPGNGLDLLPGRVSRVEAARVPHMGWNTLGSADEPLLERSGLHTAWFANGFACRPADPRAVSAWVTHDNDRFPAIVRVARTVGVQFHPEKSSAGGVAFLREFVREAGL